MRIVWDQPKRLANLVKHEIEFAEMEADFDWDAALFLPARRPRFRVLGALRGRIVSAIVQPLGSEALAIISVRAASAAEKEIYHAR